MSRIVSRAKLAEFTGKSLPTIDSWVRQGCPVVKRGGRGKEWEFDTAAVNDWRVEQKEMEAAAANAGGEADEAELKRRKLAAETMLAELELAQAKKAVAPISQVERMVANAFAQVRASVRNIPERTVAQLIGETDERRFKNVLLEEIDQTLEALSTGNLAEALEEFDEDEAAA